MKWHEVVLSSRTLTVKLSRNPLSIDSRRVMTPCGKFSGATLFEELGLADLPNSPKPILKVAGQNNMFASPVEQWLKYADARVNTAHDYSGDKAAETLLIVGHFINDAISLYQKMTRSNWE